MAGLLTLSSARLDLKIPEEGDAAAILDYHARNRAFLKPTSPAAPEGFYRLDYWRQYARNAALEFSEGRALRLIFIPKESPGYMAGHANFTAIARGPFQACFLGYSLSEESQGQGFMSEALARAIEYVFGEMNLHRIMANYMPENARSAKVLAKRGFVIEGQAKDYLLIDGAWRNHVMTSLVNPAWALP